MSTYSEMRTNIANLIRVGGQDANIGRAIKHAIRHYSREPWPWIESRSAALTTVADTKTVALPTGFSGVVKIMITVNSLLVDLDQMPQQWIEEKYLSNDFTGQPSHYGMFDEAIYLFPIPDAAYSLTMDYYAALSELSADGDTNAWTTIAEDMIEARAIWWLSNTVLMDMERASAAKQIEIDTYNLLRRQQNGVVSSGTLRAHYI